MTGSRVLKKPANTQRCLNPSSRMVRISGVSFIRPYRTDPRINGENGPLAPYTRTVLLGEADYDAD